MGNDFAPKGEDTLRQELIEATGIDPDLPENQEFISKTVALRLKDEQMKASLHDSKEKKKKTIAELEEMLKSTPKGGEAKPNYSLQDIKALSDVNDEDINDITEYANFKKISISEAKQSNVIKTLIKEKEEARQTALATATGGGRGGASKLDDNSLISAARTGSLKEDDLDRLAEARMNEKKKLNK
jgi:hypothetical protein